MDSTGQYNLAYDYQNGFDPNPVNFLLNITNQYFNSSNVPIQINLVGGIPYYMTVLVDNTNFSGATWMVYNSNLVIDLGVEGWHSVWVGVKGLAPTAQQTWQQVSLKLDLTPPVLSITNPAPGVVTQPVIENCKGSVWSRWRPSRMISMVFPISR